MCIEHFFALVNHKLSQNKSDCNTGRWREYLCIDHLSTSIKNWSSIYHYDVWWYMNVVIWPQGHKCSCCKLIEELPYCNRIWIWRHAFTQPYSYNFIFIWGWFQNRCVSIFTQLHSLHLPINFSQCIIVIYWWDLNMVTWPHSHECSCYKPIEELR